MGGGVLTPEERLAELPEEVRKAFARTRAVVLDVDGVLTDGRVHLSTDGSQALQFHVRDGSGLWLLHRADIRIGLVTGRDTGLPESGHGLFPLDGIVAGTRDKAAGLRSLLERWGLGPEECAFVGDDVLDAPALRVAGLPICVADAVQDLHEIVLYVTEHPGGRGAVREVAELVLAARGVRKGLVNRYLEGDTAR